MGQQHFPASSRLLHLLMLATCLHLLLPAAAQPPPITALPPTYGATPPPINAGAPPIYSPSPLPPTPSPSPAPLEQPPSPAPPTPSPNSAPPPTASPPFPQPPLPSSVVIVPLVTGAATLGPMTVDQFGAAQQQGFAQVISNILASTNQAPQGQQVSVTSTTAAPTSSGRRSLQQQSSDVNVQFQVSGSDQTDKSKLASSLQSAATDDVLTSGLRQQPGLGSVSARLTSVNAYDGGGGKKDNTVGLAVGLIIGLGGGLLLIGVIVWCCLKREKKRSNHAKYSDSAEYYPIELSTLRPGGNQASQYSPMTASLNNRNR